VQVKMWIVGVAARLASSELQLVLDLAPLDRLTADSAAVAGSGTCPYAIGCSAGDLPGSNRRAREELGAVRVVQRSILLRLAL
jgi:hypothetical protein